MGPLHRPRFRRVCASLWALAWLAVAGLMLMPLPSLPTPDRTDLLVHFAIFGILSSTTVSFCHRAGRLTSLAAATAVGATGLELAQTLVPYRSFDLVDMLANVTGIAVGYALALLVLQRVVRPGETEPAAPGTAMEVAASSFGGEAHGAAVEALVGGGRGRSGSASAGPERKESGDD